MSTYQTIQRRNMLIQLHVTFCAISKANKNYAGIVLTLSKYEHPDLSSFDDPEVCFRVPLEYHAGLIVKSPNHERVLELLDRYAERFSTELSATADAPEIKNFH